MNDPDDQPPDQTYCFTPWRWTWIDLFITAVCASIALIVGCVMAILMTEWLAGNPIFS